LAGLQTVGHEVESSRNGIADALDNRLSDKRSHETGSATIVRRRAIGTVDEVPHPEKLPRTPLVPTATSDEEDDKKNEATRDIA
jgi:hypothetical protein